MIIYLYVLLFIVSLCPSHGVHPYSNTMNNYFLSERLSDSPFMPSYLNAPLMPPFSNSPLMPPSSNSPFMPPSSNSPLMPPSSNSPFMAQSSNSPLMPPFSNSPFMPPSSNSPFMPPSSNSPFMAQSSNLPFTPQSAKHPFIHSSSNSPFMQSTSGFPLMYQDTSETKEFIDSRSDTENQNFIPFPKAFWTFAKTLVDDLNLKEPEMLMRINNAGHCIPVNDYLHEGRKKHLQVMVNLFCTMQFKVTVKKKRRSQRNKKNMSIDMFGPTGRSVSVIIKPTNGLYAEFKLTQMGQIVYSHLKKMTSAPLAPCFFENSLK